MFLVLKLLEPFLLPPTWIAVGLLVSLWLLARGKPKGGKILLGITLGVYYFLSTEPGEQVMVKSLGKAMPEINPLPATGASSPEAIVILAGGVLKAGPYQPRAELSGESWKRLWHGIELYHRRGGRTPILYSGGTGEPFDTIAIEGDLARQYALEIGIPEEDFWTETFSRNTYENAREIRRFLEDKYPGGGPHRIILVTSYLHMPRALKVMKKAGLEALPAPADFPHNGGRMDIFSFFPQASRFWVSTACVREWVGMAGYHFLGRL